MNLIEKSKIKNYNIKLIESKVEAGSGSLPEKKIIAWLLYLKLNQKNVQH